MTATAEVFQIHRSRLFGIACRMLGSRSEAEDVLQDAYLRWHEAKLVDVQSVVAFLTTDTLGVVRYIAGTRGPETIFARCPRRP